MKADIHPKYFEAVEIKCSCGNIIIAGSTRDRLKTELCSNCHPFYTGKQKLIDTAGRVDKFQAKRKLAQSMKEDAKKQAEMRRKKPEVYIEKVVPTEVIEKAMAGAAKQEAEGKWGGPVGDSPAQEVIKEEVAAAQMPVKEKKPAAKKSSAKKTAAKKTTVKKSSARQKSSSKK